MAGKPGLVRRGAIPYDEALMWYAHRGDLKWVEADKPVIPMEAMFLVVCYQHSESDVIKELRRLHGAKHRK